MIYGVNGGRTVGSIEGDGLVKLGGNLLITGANNLSTIFSGTIDTGSLKKIGTGIFMLSGANTYAGGTTIEGGKLVVNNRSGSGTGTGAVQVNAGILAGRGTQRHRDDYLKLSLPRGALFQIQVAQESR